MSKQLIAKWKIKEPEISRILAMLPELAEKTRSEQGNLSYVIYQAEHAPGEIILHEHYLDAAAVEAHRQSDHYQTIVMNGIIPHLESREVTFVQTLL